jgi:hypothetical protein
VTVYRWVERFIPLFIDTARPCRHAVGDRWFVDRDLREGRRPVDLPVPGRWTSSGRSSTSWAPRSETWRQLAGSSLVHLSTHRESSPSPTHASRTR